MCDQWNDVSSAYAVEVEPFTSLFAGDLVDLLELHADEVVIDAAAGSGCVSLLCAPKCKKVYATDFSAGMIDVLTQKALDRGCADRIVAAVDNGELLQTVESSSCDVYVSNFGLVFFNSPEDGLKQAKRVLRSGGRLAISTWSEHTPAFDIITNVLKQLKERNTPVGVEGVLDTKDHTIQDCGSGSDFSKRTEHLNTVNSDASAPDRAGEGTPIANNRSSQSQSSPNQAFRRFRNAYALPALMKKYEFEEVRVHPISHQLLKPTPDAYWTRMSTASPGTIHTLGELSSSDREWVKKTTIQCLTDQFGAGPVSLEAKAYIVLANKT